MIFIYNSVTAYPIQDDALKTGELDYVNGGMELIWSNDIEVCI